MNLNTYLIDVVHAILEDEEYPQAMTKMVRYSVLAPNAQEAARRFVEEGAGSIVDESDTNDMIIIGISGGEPAIEVTGR